MSAIPDSELASKVPAAPSRKRGPLRILALGGLLLLAAFATVFALFAFVPEGNSYGQATILKHERLAALTGRRVVLVGGSNLSFGVDSTIIEARTGCSTVNMGMNGYFGVRYMLNEVRPDLRAGDIVVVSFEYDNFYKSVNGSSPDLTVIAKYNPPALRFMTLQQIGGMIRQVPYIAQQKVVRIIDDSVGFVRGAWLGERTSDPVDLKAIEGFSGFEEHGDIISHIGVDWPYPREQGLDMTRLPLEREAITMIDAFSAEMQARGVDVIVSYSPVVRDFYARHEPAFHTLHREMSAAPNLVIPRPPQDYVFEEDVFFDTVYHLDGVGRAARTNRLVDDLQAALGPRAHCAAPAQAPTQGD